MIGIGRYCFLWIAIGLKNPDWTLDTSHLLKKKSLEISLKYEDEQMIKAKLKYDIF